MNRYKFQNLNFLITIMLMLTIQLCRAKRNPPDPHKLKITLQEFNHSTIQQLTTI